MIYSHFKDLEDFIIERLGVSECGVESMHSEYSEKYKPVTKQAVYKTLKKLCNDEIIIKHKDTFSINNIWKKRVVSLLEHSNRFPSLKEGESIAYSFKSFKQLDEYWKHIQEGTLEDAKTTYFFCPHQYWWFVPGRRESEINFYTSFEENKQNAILLLGGRTKTDIEMKRLISNEYVQVHPEEDHGLRMTDNLTVKNDLIIRTRLSFSTSTAINDIFNRNLSYVETEKLLQKFFNKNIAVRILIERNQKKAEKLRKQIGKYFFIKK